MTNQPNPIRTLKSHGVEDQNSEKWHKTKCCESVEHHMISVRTNSRLVPFVEQCTDCSWIDGTSLDWWAEDASKRALSDRAQRIAVATETEPFAFVQSTGQRLELDEVLLQALAAASMCWESVASAGKFEDQRAGDILVALRAEVQRFIRLAVRVALSSPLNKPIGAIDEPMQLIPPKRELHVGYTNSAPFYNKDGHAGQ